MGNLQIPQTVMLDTRINGRELSDMIDKTKNHINVGIEKLEDLKTKMYMLK
jgi:hypothetical protein